MEGNFLFDLDRVRRNISEAEVMSVFFPTFQRALVIDTRSDDEVGPLVQMMPMARSPQDRMRSIRRMRPSLPRPSNLTLIPWQRYIGSLEESGIWDQILDRVGESGDDDALIACDNALAELKKMERAELIAAITGENYHTLWPIEAETG